MTRENAITTVPADDPPITGQLSEVRTLQEAITLIYTQKG